MSVTIRMFKAKDREAVEGLFLEKNSQLKWNFFEFLLNSNYSNIVAEKNGVIIGFGTLIKYHTASNGRVGRLEDIFVHPDHQGRGYGKMIVKELTSLGERLLLNKIFLTSNRERAAARHIYESLGFVLYETGVFVKNFE